MSSSVITPLKGAAAAITDASAGGFSGVSATAVTSAAACAPPPAVAEAGARRESQKNQPLSPVRETVLADQPEQPCCSRQLAGGGEIYVHREWHMHDDRLELCQLCEGSQLQPSGLHLQQCLGIDNPGVIAVSLP